MKCLVTLLNKTMRVGPLPYLALCIAILMIGVVLQVRAANPVLSDGSTIFGLFARIGGFVGLFGLLPLAFAVRDEDDADTREPSAADETPGASDPVQKSRPRTTPHRGAIGLILKSLPRRTA